MKRFIKRDFRVRYVNIVNFIRYITHSKSLEWNAIYKGLGKHDYNYTTATNANNAILLSVGVTSRLSENFILHTSQDTHVFCIIYISVS